jgi:hypothetical protein
MCNQRSGTRRCCLTGAGAQAELDIENDIQYDTEAGQTHTYKLALCIRLNSLRNESKKLISRSTGNKLLQDPCLVACTLLQ